MSLCKLQIRERGSGWERTRRTFIVENLRMNVMIDEYYILVSLE
jgi:hypothetical protein